MTERLPNQDALTRSQQKLFEARVASVADFLASSGVDVDVRAALAGNVDTVDADVKAHADGSSQLGFNSRDRSLTISGKRNAEAAVGDTHEIVHGSSRVRDTVPPGYAIREDGTPELPGPGSSLRRIETTDDGETTAQYHPAAARKIGPYTEVRTPTAQVFWDGNEEARWVVQDFFYGLSEALTDEEAHQAHELGRGSLSRLLKPSAHEAPFYLEERRLLRTIATQLARRMDIPEREAWSIFWRVNHFGWTKECKTALLKSFGPNALRVLAVLSTSFRREMFYRNVKHELKEGTTHLGLGTNVEDYETFFTTDDSAAREHAAKRMLRFSNIPYREPRAAGHDE